MIVILIIGILAAYVGPKLAGQSERASVTSTKAQIKVLANALTLYQAENGSYPSSEQGLKALVSKPESEPVPRNWRRYLSRRSLPKDAWGREYQYRNPGEKEDVDIYSMGKNKDSEKDDIYEYESESKDDDDDKG